MRPLSSPTWVPETLAYIVLLSQTCAVRHHSSAGVSRSWTPAYGLGSVERSQCEECLWVWGRNASYGQATVKDVPETQPTRHGR
jgi:hypothetical protein